MYHRVANLETDPWQLAVNIQNFEQQLQELKKNYKIISISELSEQLSNKNINADSICITFDDAYSDNYKYAKPLLEKYDCPATFFVPTHFIGQQKQFWWDELENILLHSIELPASISLLIRQREFKFHLSDKILTKNLHEKHKAWVWPEKPPTQRCELYLELWEQLQPLTLSELNPLIDEIRTWAGYIQPINKDDFPMSSHQLEDIFHEPLFNVGIHTHTHEALAFHTKEIQQNEIISCRNYLQEHLGKSVNTLAYPYGSYDDTTLDIIKEQNIISAFTTQEEIITKDSDSSRLGRFQVLNQSGKEFEKQLRKWLK